MGKRKDKTKREALKHSYASDGPGDVEATERIKKALKKVKFKQRREMEILPPGLDLNFFRAANVARSEDPKGFDHPLNAWSVAEWTNAGAGEQGEACNLSKKLLRIDKKLRGNIKADDKKREKVVNKLAKELCDVIAYADLTLARIGRNTSVELVKVFNAKSKQLGYDFKL